MKQSLLSGKWGRMMVLGMIGLCSALSLSAQDDAIEKKPEGVAVEQPEGVDDVVVGLGSPFE